MAAVLVAANDTSRKDRTRSSDAPASSSINAQRATVNMKIPQRNAKSGLHPHQRRQDSVGERAATQAHRCGHAWQQHDTPSSLSRQVVNSRIGSQENVDNLFPANSAAKTRAGG
jgi:hypothetical protein